MSSIIELRLTKDNLDDLRTGDLILDGGEDLGRIEKVRLTRDGFDNAKIIGTDGSDVLGLPSNIRVDRP